jgi:hypothetical protein
LVCGDVKSGGAQECRSTDLKEMQMFYEKLLAEYTKKWQNCCSHVKNLEEEYWQRDGLMNEANDNMIIHLGESSYKTSTDEGQFWSLSEDE